MQEQVKVHFDLNVLGTIATISEDGSPWSTPLHVVTDGEAVYWFSKETAVHSRNITRDERVSLTLFSPDESEGPKGVYITGRAKKLTADQDQWAREVARKRLGSLPSVFATASAYKLDIGTYDEHKSAGNCWYFYS